MNNNTQIILCPNFEPNCAPGESFSLGNLIVIETPVINGDFLVHGDTYITLECDKASIDLPSPVSGRVMRMYAKIGDEVTQNSPIIEIEVLKNVVRDDLSIGQPSTQVDGPNTVFLVHGHNEAIREMSARLLEKLGLTVIILNEQAGASDTLIEKLERYANVHFAVVLMTADDLGGQKNAADRTLRDRARQNVVLELGYFMGKINRRRVCVIYERGVELPSDYYGVAYIELDNGGAWRYSLAKELKGAGLGVDLNKL
ncbi:TIR domain-containing protein [Pseudomonas sp. CFBP 8772]|uniref:TIR domain-containing protein n=1 Tax=Pseudomonas sp. CFBP 8772 TaxID=2775284 RepID=UPI00177DEBA1|nr:nucleotide-binding protein [Pseudomonas sp. CFBP 8772]